MNVEYTGRQFEITPAIRKEVETGLNKLTKILGENFKSKVILTAEKQRRIAEITITRRTSPIVAVAESVDMTLALGEALENIERQVLKFNGRRRDTKRVAKSKWKREAPEIESQLVVGATAGTAVPVVVHKFPASSHTSEAHLVTNHDSVAARPLTVEEAIKECEFRDREVFVFHDKAGQVKVLHRRKDGKLEIIEA
jgi:putative sigma-54 modulation protein